MGISCAEILKLPDAEGLELIGGMTGLGREVLWIHIGDGVGAMHELDRWINGHELVFITGKGLDGHLEDALEAFPRLNEKQAAGVVINVGPYFPEIPEELIKLADKLALPLFRLPWKYKLVDVTRAVGRAVINSERSAANRATLLEEILFGTPPGEELPELLAGAGVEGVGEYVIGVMAAAGEDEPESTREALQLRRRLYSAASSAFADAGVKVMLMQRGSGMLVFLCAQSPRLREKLERAVKTADGQLSRGVRMGLGKACGTAAGLRRSYTQARQALRCAGRGELSLYSRLGLDALLMEMPDRERLEELFHATLGPVLAYDAAGGACLYKTLEKCFDCNFDLNTAAEELFVHKNTVRYRLSKIEELLGRKLHDVQTIVLLGACIKIGRILDEEISEE
ncbi:MAG: PucR family transcriptional regulator [Candidatus Heteroscillospira sp.]|jgi:hypothetical protein